MSGRTARMVREFYRTAPREKIERLIARAERAVTDDDRAVWDGPKDEYVPLPTLPRRTVV